MSACDVGKCLHYCLIIVQHREILKSLDIIHDAKEKPQHPVEAFLDLLCRFDSCRTCEHPVQ